MNLANTCHLLKPDSQVIPRLGSCLQRQDCWGHAHKKGWRGHLSRGPSNAALFPCACFVHLCFTDCEWQLEWAQNPSSSPFGSTVQIPFSSGFQAWALAADWSFQALGNLPSHFRQWALFARFTQQASPLEGEWGVDARSSPSRFTEFATFFFPVGKTLG